MGSRVFAVVLCVFGTVVIAVALALIFLGPQLTGELLTMVLIAPFWSRAFGGAVAPNLSAVDADSELRFMAVFFLAYGVGLFRIGMRYPTLHRYVPLMLALFLAGGLARIWSWVQIGAPAALFQVLGLVELALPVILFAAYLMTRPAK